ncbi:unnamed protein product [Pleuronectes platessa]|uniref:Uncharacterized protein n=1 Tax=Pleuronectes platessa TaxID=8262 RepID=A0A9N7YKR0_PLEPL|nr:unnamed protein product [Pleuronectes platessa]
MAAKKAPQPVHTEVQRERREGGAGGNLPSHTSGMNNTVEVTGFAESELVAISPEPCIGFSRWNHGMEVISQPIPLWTVIRCRQCAMDPKGRPSAYFHSFQSKEDLSLSPETEISFQGQAVGGKGHGSPVSSHLALMYPRPNSPGTRVIPILLMS